MLLTALGAALLVAAPLGAIAKATHHRPSGPPHTAGKSHVAAGKAHATAGKTHAAAGKAHVAAGKSSRHAAVSTARVRRGAKPDAKAARAGKHAPVVAPVEAGRPVIVIDPGHGGRDPGAIGARGTQEKDVTLAIAQQLRRALEATGRYRTAMTRTGDKAVSLSDRLDFARRHDADLLIAIHADASPDRHARGASVYVSSGHSVSHMAASAGNSARIAQALKSGAPRPGQSSAWLQYSMIDQLSDEVQMVVAPARAAHLYVLGSRSIPSVLLETGFISNRAEEALLGQPAYRRRLVGAMKDAVEDYFRGLRDAAPRT